MASGSVSKQGIEIVSAQISRTSSMNSFEGGEGDTLVFPSAGDGEEREEWEMHKRQGEATVVSSVSNLANTIIGSGALAFPSAFASMGLIPGMISCAFSGLTAAFGLYLLSRCATQVGRPRIPSSSTEGDQTTKESHHPIEASFNTVALLTFGQGWATRCFDAAIAIKCFGVSVSYLIIVKTLMPQVILSLSHHLPIETLPPTSMLLDGRLWLLLSMVVIVPLSFLRRLDSLRFTSQVALASVVYLVFIVVGWWVLRIPTETKRGKVVLARFGASTLSSFPVQVFAYTCAQNLFPVYNELKNNTQRRMNLVIGTSIGSAVGVYEILGIAGYLTFGSTVGSNVIAMYPFTSPLIAIGRLGIVLLVALSYPLQCHPCRACLHTLSTGWSKSSHQPLTQNQDSEIDSEDSDDDEQGKIVEMDHAAVSSRKMGQVKFVSLTCGIVALGLAVALVIDELEVVLGFVGSTGSTIISFILPGLFYFTLFRSNTEDRTKWFALALSIYGCCVMVFCLSFNIYKLVHHTTSGVSHILRSW